jgi:aspartyl protease family protein
MRFDLASLGVLSLAVASSLGVLWTLDLGGVLGSAQAEEAKTGYGEARVVRAADGHYWADARIHDRPVRLMIDTGASRVVLTRDDAVRLGLNIEPEAFSMTLTTASGQARAAPVVLQAVAVDSARVEQVDALIVDSGLPHSLLGMSYLGRLTEFRATPTQLTLQG